MRRREFIGLVGSAAALPVLARAQQSMPVMGFVSGASPFAPYLAAFREGLGNAGYVEGSNVAIEYRWAENQYDRLPALLADLIQRRVAVIVATTPPAVLAAKAATTTIPIVFQLGSHPAELDLLGRDNITGVAQLDTAILPTQLQLLRQLVPTTDVFAFLVNPNSPGLTERTTRTMQSAAEALGLKLHVLNASSERDLGTAFERIVALRVGGLVIGSDPFFVGQLEALAALTVRHAVPAIFATREFVLAGGLMSYGANVIDAYRQVGVTAARVLNGEKPRDMPVQLGTKIEMFINRRAVNVLGLKIPRALNLHPDELIE
jgi:putative ABC transport system substrate-binding protein